MSNKRSLEASTSSSSSIRSKLNNDQNQSSSSESSSSKKLKSERNRKGSKPHHTSNNGRDGDDGEDDDLDYDELNQVNKLRKGRVKTDGYDSDSSTENNEVREKKKKSKDKNGDGDDEEDMFGGDDDDDNGGGDAGKNSSKSNKKFEKIDVGMNLKKGAEAKDYLELGDIEGQEFGKEVDEDEEDDDDGDDEDDDGRRRRIRNGKKVRSKEDGDEYGSDEEYSNEEEDYVPGDEFANDDDAPRARRKSKKGMGFVMSKFNMAEELKEGRMTADGSYVPSAKDPEAAHDNWLEGVNKKAMKQAREAKKKQDEEIRRRLEMSESLQSHRSRKDCYVSLLSLLPSNTGKSVSHILVQLGNKKKSFKSRTERKRPTVKKSPIESLASGSVVPDPSSSSSSNDTVDSIGGHGNSKVVESSKVDQNNSIKTEEKVVIDRRITEITDLASTLMANHGDLDIYDMTHGSITGMLKSEGLVPRDWAPPSDNSMSFLTQTLENSTIGPEPPRKSLIARPSTLASTTSQPVQITGTGSSDTPGSIYYRFKPDPSNPNSPNNSTVYGPFDRSMMEGWASQGFFGPSFDLIEVKSDSSGTGNSRWGNWKDIIN